jgi:hypothetical protein
LQGIGRWNAEWAVVPPVSSIAANALAATHTTERDIARQYAARPLAKTVFPHPADASNTKTLLAPAKYDCENWQSLAGRRHTLMLELTRAYCIYHFTESIMLFCRE